MAFQLEIEQHWTVEKTMTADDATITLVAAEPYVSIVVTSLIVTAQTPAAIAVWFGDSSGTVKVLRLPASKPDAGSQAAIQLVHGLHLTETEAFWAVAVGAQQNSPVLHIVAEGYKLRNRVPS